MTTQEPDTKSLGASPQTNIGGEEVREVYDVNLFQRFGLTPIPTPYTNEMFRLRLYAILGIILFGILYSIAFGQLGLVATLVIMSPWIFIQLLQFRNPSLRREIVFLVFPLLAIARSTPQGLGESGLPLSSSPATLALVMVSSVGFIIAMTSNVVLTSWVQANFSPNQRFIKAQDQETKEMLERSKKALQDTRFSFDYHITEPESPRRTLETRTIRTSILVLLSAVAVSLGIIMFVQLTEQISPLDPFPTRTYLVSTLALGSLWSIAMIRELLRQEFNEFYVQFIRRKAKKTDEMKSKSQKRRMLKIRNLFGGRKRKTDEKK